MSTYFLSVVTAGVPGVCKVDPIERKRHPDIFQSSDQPLGSCLVRKANPLRRPSVPGCVRVRIAATRRSQRQTLAENVSFFSALAVQSGVLPHPRLRSLCRSPMAAPQQAENKGSFTQPCADRGQQKGSVRDMHASCQARTAKVIPMSYTIRVPLNSPAFQSYVHEGWYQLHVDGLWATLRRDQGRRNPARTAPPNWGGAGGDRESKDGKDRE